MSRAILPLPPSLTVGTNVKAMFSAKNKRSTIQVAVHLCFSLRLGRLGSDLTPLTACTNTCVLLAVCGWPCAHCMPYFNPVLLFKSVINTVLPSPLHPSSITRSGSGAPQYLIMGKLVSSAKLSKLLAHIRRFFSFVERVLSSIVHRDSRSTPSNAEKNGNLESLLEGLRDRANVLGRCLSRVEVALMAKANEPGPDNAKLREDWSAITNVRAGFPFLWLPY